MDVPTWIAAVREQGELLAEAAATVSLDTTVPSCPEWQVRDLVRHTGNVHRWAARVVAEAYQGNAFAFRAQLLAAEVEPTDEALVDWFRSGYAGLVEALKAAPTDLDCFTFVTTSSPLEFWARRQTHETAIHRVDAELAAGAPTPVDADLAVDGIDELLTMFLALRGGALRAESERTLQVSAAGRHWLVRIGPDSATVTESQEQGRADCTVSGDPGALYLALWNRAPWTSLTVSGDESLLALWSEKVRIGGERG
ncbi:MAG TPA: maleylpyruvate isomerase family mycothiol-dependent enzyme [Pseudonocardiaceae bacterium]|nr:maleylpyruvate isomerase family mycothiol-dependent enzyme [Pseudonocardiaceae bacterium]